MAAMPFWGNENVMQAEGLSPDILAYGDSWFWYPNNDLLIPINAIWQGTKTLLAKGKNGAELREMVGGTPRLWKDFNSAMSGYPTIQCVLLSAGGNDFAGTEHFASLLRLDCSAATSADECFDPGDAAQGIERQPWRMLRELATNYQHLIDFIRSVKATVPIVLQDYDYAIPDDIGFGGVKGGIFGLGGWLQQPMVARQVPTALQADVVRRLMDDFITVLKALADPAQNHDVYLVETAGTLTDADWANEMHPTPAGFNRLAERFRPLLQTLIPGTP
jgi:hypothetical protein